MFKRKRNIIILVILCVLLILMGVFIYIDIFVKNNTHSFDNNDNKQDIYDGNIIDENDDEITSNQEEYNSNNYLDGETSDNQNNYKEEDVVYYFESMESEVHNSTSFKEKFKEYFVTIIDFIFYDTEIKGYTFNELTGTAKAKIIAIALKIDNKIEDYVPGYKDSISSTTGKVYTDIKGKLVTSYMDISSVICKDNEEECEIVKDIFGDVKDYCEIGWDFVKVLIRNGTTKIRDWYEIYSGK